MAYTSKDQFKSYQGRAYQNEANANAFRRRMRVPMVTVALGLVAAMVIAGGGLDHFVAQTDTLGLSGVEFLTGELPKAE